ncbi:Atu4866 domain-containing protein [Rhizobium sullae]|uniref:Atu4866 domain-containing protein n=1 Tax=Rhizobium sullae TaxID=50338 RepID=UPI001FCFFDFE|nr:Atu4866 domain-containing protein [Rhizobium sullae]
MIKGQAPALNAYRSLARRRHAYRVFGKNWLALTVLAILSAPANASDAGSNRHEIKDEHRMTDHPYVGMWTTSDNRVRHNLLPSGRYDEARGNRESAYEGRYEIRGNHIEYWDDTGFTADGTFVDRNTLHHGGMILRRR